MVRAAAKLGGLRIIYVEGDRSPALATVAEAVSAMDIEEWPAADCHHRLLLFRKDPPWEPGDLDRMVFATSQASVRSSTSWSA